MSFPGQSEGSGMDIDSEGNNNPEVPISGGDSGQVSLAELEKRFKHSLDIGANTHGQPQMQNPFQGLAASMTDQQIQEPLNPLLLDSVVERIAYFLPKEDLANSSLVCKIWKDECEREEMMRLKRNNQN